MKVIIVGCGRVGEQLARFMANEGHKVTIIDFDAKALERLGPDFKGEKIKGVGFDRQVLIKAGIENAHAFAATSASDNVNIIAARIAKNIFHVPHVVARLYDPRRAEIYHRLGLLTISSTTWGAERIRELLTQSELDALMTFGSGEVSMLGSEAPPSLSGRMVKDIRIPAEVEVVAISRDGHAFIPGGGSTFKTGDIIYIAVLASSMERVKMMLGLQEGE